MPNNHTGKWLIKFSTRTPLDSHFAPGTIFTFNYLLPSLALVDSVRLWWYYMFILVFFRSNTTSPFPQLTHGHHSDVIQSIWTQRHRADVKWSSLFIQQLIKYMWLVCLGKPLGNFLLKEFLKHA